MGFGVKEYKNKEKVKYCGECCEEASYLVNFQKEALYFCKECYKKFKEKHK